jgi:hypothetical protein
MIKIYIFYFAPRAFPSSLFSFSASQKINKKRKAGSIVALKYDVARPKEVAWGHISHFSKVPFPRL